MSLLCMTHVNISVVCPIISGNMGASLRNTFIRGVQFYGIHLLGVRVYKYNKYIRNFYSMNDALPASD